MTQSQLHSTQEKALALESKSLPDNGPQVAGMPWDPGRALSSGSDRRYPGLLQPLSSLERAQSGPNGCPPG